MASLGIPKTTLVFHLVQGKPTSIFNLTDLLPSRPIPVKIIPMAYFPTDLAIDFNKISPEGLTPCRGGF